MLYVLLLSIAPTCPLRPQLINLREKSMYIVGAYDVHPKYTYTERRLMFRFMVSFSCNLNTLWHWH